MTRFNVMVLGGHGLFGSRIARRLARDGDGPEIPATAAVVIATKLARGAQPCLDLFTLDEFLESLRGFAIETRSLVG